MRIYIDTGVFIDYLSPQAIAGEKLRSTSRRGRTPQALFQDAENALKRTAASHTGATSSLTFYEVEEALFGRLTSAATEMGNASTLRVLVARSIVPQTVTAARFFGVEILDLTAETVGAQLGNLDLHMRGVRAADALHIASAINFDAEVLISADEDMLKLNGVIVNKSGIPITFCDTDKALTIL